MYPNVVDIRVIVRKIDSNEMKARLTRSCINPQISFSQEKERKREEPRMWPWISGTNSAAKLASFKKGLMLQ